MFGQPLPYSPHQSSRLRASITAQPGPSELHATMGNIFFGHPHHVSCLLTAPEWWWRVVRWCRSFGSLLTGSPRGPEDATEIPQKKVLVVASWESILFHSFRIFFKPVIRWWFAGATSGRKFYKAPGPRFSHCITGPRKFELLAWLAAKNIYE